MTWLLEQLRRSWCWLRRHPQSQDVCLLGCTKKIEKARRARAYREAQRALRGSR